MKKERTKLLKPKYDVVFRALFGEKNIELAEVFISDILGQKVRIKHILDRHLNIKVAEQKLGIMDYRTILEDNTTCNIEIQLNEHEFEIERFLYYLADSYSRQLSRGNEYERLNKTISIVILDHEIDKLKSIDRLDIKWQMRDNMTGKVLLTDKFEMCIIELPKARRLYEGKEDRLCDWMLFLDDPNSKEVLKIMEKNEDIKEAVERLEYVSNDEEIRRIAELKEKARRDENAVKAFMKKKGYEEGFEQGLEAGKQAGMKQGIEQGMKQGMKQGKEQNQKEIAQNMLKEKIDITVISKITGLTKEQISCLK